MIALILSLFISANAHAARQYHIGQCLTGVLTPWGKCLKDNTCKITQASSDFRILALGKEDDTYLVKSKLCNKATVPPADKCSVTMKNTINIDSKYIYYPIKCADSDI